MTLLEAPAPPAKRPSNSLLADAVARLVSAATAETALAVEPPADGVALPLAAVPAAATVFAAEAALAVLKRVDSAEAWALLRLPIDMMTPDRDGSNQGCRPGFEDLEAEAPARVFGRSPDIPRMRRSVINKSNGCSCNRASASSGVAGLDHEQPNSPGRPCEASTARRHAQP